MTAGEQARNLAANESAEEVGVIATHHDEIR